MLGVFLIFTFKCESYNHIEDRCFYRTKQCYCQNVRVLRASDMGILKWDAYQIISFNIYDLLTITDKVLLSINSENNFLNSVFILA